MRPDMVLLADSHDRGHGDRRPHRDLVWLLVGLVIVLWDDTAECKYVDVCAWDFDSLLVVWCPINNKAKKWNGDFDKTGILVVDGDDLLRGRQPGLDNSFI